MKIQCPNCKRSDLFETTDKFRPDAAPNGSFVRSLAKYHIDWLTSSTTLCSEMTCCECLAQLAPSGRLTVIPDMPVTPLEEQKAPYDGPGDGSDLTSPFSDDNPPPAFICDICGKRLKNQFGLTGHMRSHAKKEA